MAAFTAASLDLPQREEDVEEVPREDGQAEQEGRQGREHAGGAPLQQPEGWADYFDLPTFPDNDGNYDDLTEQERHELQELEDWRRMQEEARTEQRRRLELLRRQRAQEMERLRISYPSTRAVHGSQPSGPWVSDPLASDPVARHLWAQERRCVRLRPWSSWSAG